jgi:N-acetylated-alpha-linked acidic dipeptidase
MSKLRKAWNKEELICLDAPETLFTPALGPLGSGSDYTVFADHLGIASLNFSFTGSYGVYHSTFDDFFWMKRFGDPEFLYHAVAARLFGLLAMRLAGADLVPLRYHPYAEALADQLDGIRRRAVAERRDAAATEKPSPHPPLTPDFGPIRLALADFRGAADSLDAALDALSASAAPTAERLARINDAVVRVEREFLSKEGLTGRPWFRHVLYAPGLTTGYASWPFPGLTQAVKDHDSSLWEKESRKVLERLASATSALRSAERLAREAAHP